MVKEAMTLLLIRQTLMIEGAAAVVLVVEVEVLAAEDAGVLEEVVIMGLLNVIIAKEKATCPMNVISLGRKEL